MANTIAYDYKIFDRFTGPLNKIRRSTEKMRQTAKKTAAGVNKMGNSFKKAGDKMKSAQSAMAGIGAGLALKGVIDTTNNFETAMNNVNAITIASAESMARLRSQAKNLGATTQFSASQAADAMGFLGMAGLSTEQIMQAMPGTLQLAAAGGMDLASAADIATNVLAQMGMKVSELGKVNDALAMTASSANTNVLEMAEALKNVGTTASSLGVNLNQTSAMIGKMADAGVKGGEAGTLLRNAMTRVVNPSKKALRAFRKLRIDVRQFKTPDGKLKNFTGLIEKLKTSGASTTDIFNIFEERGARAILALTAAGGPAIDALKKKLDEAGGAAERMAKTKMKGLPGALKTLTSSFEGLVIAVGEKLTPVILKITDKFTQLFSYLSTRPELAAIIAGVLGLGAAIPILMIPLGFLISAMGTLLTIITAISWPIVGIVAIVALVAASFVYWWKSGHPLITSLKNIGKMIWQVLYPIRLLLSKLGIGNKTMGLFANALKLTGYILLLSIKPFELLLTIATSLFEVFGKLFKLDFTGAFGSLKRGLSKIRGVFSLGGGDETEAESKKVVESSVEVKKQQNVNVGGLIEVAAKKGTEIISAKPNLNTGGNLEYSY